VVGLNQQRYETLAAYPDLDVTLVFPTHYVSDFDGRRLNPDKTSAEGYRILCGPPVFAGNGSLYFYRGGLREAFEISRPELVFVDEEPWSLSAAQAVWASHRRKAKAVFFTNQNLRKPLPPPFSWIQRRVFRKARWAFTAGEEAAAVLRWKGYTGPISLLPFGVDPGLFRPQDAAGLREELGLTGTVFAYFGRLVREKGVEVFVRAGLRLCDQAPDAASFLLAGSGPEADSLRQIIAQTAHGRRFVFVERALRGEAPRYLCSSDVVVVPSVSTRRWKEQFGRILVEALACGVPVIGSDSGEVPFLIRRLGGGLVVPEGDVMALATAMTELMREPARRRALAEAGRASVLASYTHQAVAATMRDVFLRVADDRE
jgi:glycosyltransferase involved in cell wall biosynthesis